MDPLEVDAYVYDDDEVIDLETPAVVPFDFGRAGWHARKALAVDDQARAARVPFDEAIAAITDRRDRMLERLDRERRWHASAVEAWHRRAFALKTVGKTVEFPTGGVSTLRAAQMVTDLYDEDGLRGWLSCHLVDDSDPSKGTLEDVVYKVKEPELGRQALKGLVTIPTKKGGREPGEVVSGILGDTGEVVPGVRFVAVPDRHGLGA